MAAAMTAETIARALGGASRSSNGWWQAKCPAHEDRTASLGLHDADDGGVAWKCMAGCDSAAVGDALKAKGLLPERTKRERTAKRKIVATYDYRDAVGELVLQVVRYQPKDFRQRRPDPDKPGAWIWKLGHIGRPLYRLPELIGADLAEDVFLVEGEKDSDRLGAIGLVATTTAQGAKGWSKTYHAPLAGRHVVILPDNDEAGLAYAAQAGRDLIGNVASLRLLALPGLPPKGDVSDWFDAGGTADQLRHLAAEAPAYDPPPEVDAATDDTMAALRALADLDPLTYEQRRKEEAKNLGIRTSALDRAVEDLRSEASTTGAGRALAWPMPEPWDEPVVGADLLDDIVAAFAKFVVLPAGADTALALWVVHAHSFATSTITPRLALLSPSPRCGKTTCLEVIHALVPKPLMACNVTAAALFRTIEVARPTVLIDEADSFIAEAEELRGVLNSGHRQSGEVIRTTGENHEPRRFSTWAPVAIAAIGKLPGTLEDRSIKIEMRRRMPGETVERWRVDRQGQFHDIVRRCVRWVRDRGDHLVGADPPVPNELHDRAADNWRPLLAIADAAGGAWPERSRKAASTLSAGNDVDSRREMLLADIRTVFADRGNPDWLASQAIIAALLGMDERPWSEASRGKPVNSQAMRSLLKPFGVFSTSNGKVRGYKLEAFADAWARYLLPDAGEGAFDPSIRKKPSNGAAFEPTSIRQSGNGFDGSASAVNPHGHWSADGLTDQTPEDDGDEEIVI